MASELHLAQHATVVRNPGQLSADIDGEAVVLSIDAGRYYDLNRVGTRIWALVEQPISVAALIDVLVREFEVERKVCEEDVLVFLRQLHTGGLVQISEP
jgi:hypothetical protein